ncbi:GmrSD restriction endonuclease domain-containing protein [Corynebacterium aquatimens]|uniref:GmrSD restriction endonuclease domain-containing protein n=1 Tax=Corynebacterium aquatimens TaxID=1190508 RepID=UPI003313233E
MGFTTPSYSLIDLFARAERGELQLPDFQREYIWDVDRIRTLITSVLRGYPVGSFLALDTRNSPVRFRPRPLAGLDIGGAEPGLLLLDGQQRLTSLYHAFKGKGLIPTVDYLGEPINRRFFVDVRAAVASDPMPVESVFAVDEEGRVRSHFGPGIDGGISNREDMLRYGVVPVSALLWQEGNDLLVDMAASAEDPAMREAVKEFHHKVLRWLPAYDVPVIRVDRDTTRIGVGQIFAHANSAGVQMDVFELLTAMFASQDPDFVLADHWAGVEKQLRAYPALDRIGRIEYLRALALLITSRRGRATGHRGDILTISLDEYRAHADEVTGAFVQVAEFLQERCIFSLDQVPYTSQLVPLATILARLAEHPGALEQERSRDRLNCWFWSGVFSELYGAHAPTIRAGLDVTEVTPWVLGRQTLFPAR